MAANREQFGSKLGFILAAAGSAVGIGNIVGFPVNAAKKWWGSISCYLRIVCSVYLFTRNDG